MLSKSHRTFSILRMQERTPSIALELLKSCMRILTIVLITVVKATIWPGRPHELRQCFGQHAPVLLAGFDSLFSPFLVLDIGAGTKPPDDLTCFITYRHPAA